LHIPWEGRGSGRIGQNIHSVKTPVNRTVLQIIGCGSGLLNRLEMMYYRAMDVKRVPRNQLCHQTGPHAGFSEGSLCSLLFISAA